MSTPYQSLHYPPPVASVVALRSDTCCGPDCIGCCAKPKCCLEPNCCSRVGACPCFCTGSTAAFSLALCALWAAFPMLVVAMTLVDLYTYDAYSSGTPVQMGMWQACTYYAPGYGWAYQCSEYGNPVSLGDIWNDSADTAMFNAMRVMTLICSVSTLIAGVLGAIRLAYQQRAKPISSMLNNVLLASAVLSFCTVIVAFSLSCVLYNHFWSYWYYSRTVSANRGAAWAVLTAAFSVLVIAVPLHLLAHYSNQRNIKQQSAEQPGMETAAYSAMPASVFVHPQPQYFAAMAYPTAAAVMPPSTQSTTSTPHGYMPAIPPTYLYAR